MKQQMATYDAVRTSEEDQARQIKLVEEHGREAKEEKPSITSDPLSSFENYHFEIMTALKLWMTFDKDSRIAKAKDFCRGVSPFMESTYKWNRVKRHKTLNYIMWLESVHPHGDREVAAVAFNGLFGIKEKGK